MTPAENEYMTRLEEQHLAMVGALASILGCCHSTMRFRQPLDVNEIRQHVTEGLPKSITRAITNPATYEAKGTPL